MENHPQFRKLMDLGKNSEKKTLFQNIEEHTLSLRKKKNIRQRVYELHFLEGYSLTEVAAIMGTSIPSIHKHKEKILKFIKENFKRG